MKNFFYHLSLLESRITAHFSQEKYLHPERFSYPHEFAHLSFAKPHDYGLFLEAVLKLLSQCFQEYR
jgi:hypothetical protein